MKVQLLEANGILLPIRNKTHLDCPSNFDSKDNFVLEAIGILEATLFLEANFDSENHCV